VLCRQIREVSDHEGSSLSALNEFKVIAIICSLRLRALCELHAFVVVLDKERMTTVATVGDGDAPRTNEGYHRCHSLLGFGVIFPP